MNQAEQLMQLVRQRKERELQVLVRIEADALVITHRWQGDPTLPHIRGGHATHA